MRCLGFAIVILCSPALAGDLGSRGNSDVADTGHTYGTFYGEFVISGGGAVTPDAANQWHAITSFTTGMFGLPLSFSAGSTGPIAAFADGTGGTVTVTDVAHGLSTGDVVTISGTTNYNGVFAITKVDADNFKITDTWVANDATGNWYRGDSFLIGAGGAGEYKLQCNFSATKGAGAAATVIVQAYVNATAETHAKTTRYFAATDTGAFGISGTLTVADGDVVWLAFQSTNTNTLTPNDATCVLMRL